MLSPSTFSNAHSASDVLYPALLFKTSNRREHMRLKLRSYVQPPAFFAGNQLFQNPMPAFLKHNTQGAAVRLRIA
jgi:hypothetical protein